MKFTLSKRRETFQLDSAGIDAISQLAFDTMLESGMARRDALRLRLSIEDILLTWRNRLGEVACHFRCGMRFRHPMLSIAVPGDRLGLGSDEDEQFEIYTEILSRSGLAPSYSYHNGENRLMLDLTQKKQMNAMVRILLAIGLAALLGIACRFLPDAGQAAVIGIVDPLFSTLMGILSALAGPLIFLSVCCGVLGIGDVSTLGKIGKVIVPRLLSLNFLASTVAAVLCFSFFRSSTAASAGSEDGAIGQIYAMLLDIIPSNLMAPFVEGNTLQIIFLACCAGIGLLILGDKCSALKELLFQLQHLIDFFMGLIGRYIAVLTFLSIFLLILNGGGQMSGILKAMLMALALCWSCQLLLLLSASIRCKVPLSLFIKKKLPAYMVALTTASSSAALSSNLDICEQKLGISPQMTKFAVPLGQVMLRPGHAIGFTLVSMAVAEQYGVQISLSWLVTAVICIGLLAVAIPPVAGGALACYAVLFSQLGIPADAIAVAVVWEMIFDYIATSCNISSVQSMLLLCARKLQLIDNEVLLSDTPEQSE